MAPAIAGGAPRAPRADPTRPTAATIQTYCLRIGSPSFLGEGSYSYCPLPAGPMGLRSLACDANHAFQIAASGVSSGCKVRRKCTRSQASPGLRSSAKEGIGVPSSPVMKIRYRSRLVTPHLKREPVEKLYGGIGFSLLSVSVLADWPSPCPAGPWHFQHSIFWKRPLPRRMLSMVAAGSGGIAIGVPGFRVLHFGENVLMYATASARF